MNLFERYLSVWVGLCIVGGVILGKFFPDVFQLVA
ncbi:MAG TPA: arsenical-resistance protein, partial [Gammaproteobacteria bacterium]|nr:arsenical-resistance protein [Gammaproteobacteria bacterium]